MSTTELILFSGGTDSTILLKHFLQEKKKVRVLYIQMAWGVHQHKKLELQGKAVGSILDYMRENYGEFEYSEACIYTTLNEPTFDKYLGRDQEWCALFGSMFCNVYNIPRMWTGNFTYTHNLIMERDGVSDDFWNGDDLAFWLNCGTRFADDPPEYCTPRLKYKGKGIDRFKNKKVAWNTLEKELQKKVRSCLSDKWFCGECYKCTQEMNSWQFKQKNTPSDSIA